MMTANMTYLKRVKPRILLPVLLMLVGSTLQGQQLAFPGAQGGGRFATGGRSGAVYEVTNLNDAGVGSLRDAVSQPNRTVIFKVSGTIHLASKLVVSKNNITIAGQTAPGDGICIVGNTFNIRASDIIIRYIRCRLTDLDDVVDDSMNGYSGPYQNIIVDHCSLSWSVDETGTFYDIQNFTLQWCLLSESLYHSVHNKGDHGYAGIWGGTNSSFHHNLLAHHTSRNPRFGGSRYTGRPDLEIVDFRNNVLYNWGNINSAYGGEGGNYNMVNNYYKPGPATPGNLTTSSASNKRNRILNYTSYYYASDAYVYPDTLFGGKFYITGNYVEGYPDVTADNWTKGVQPDGFKRAAALMQAAKQSVPFVVPPVRTQTAQDAYASVLDSVGAILPRRDAIDKRITREARTGTATYEGATYAAITSTGISHPSGIIDTQSDAGGLPAYTSTVAPTDTDHDGIPDTWEVSNSLNPNNVSDGNLITSNGYSNLENYLNSIVNTDVGVDVYGTLSNFVQSVGTPTSVQTYSISGVNLTSNIIITPPVGYEVSADGGTNWYTNASPLALIPSGGRVLTTNISVRLNASSADSYSGYISNTTNGIAAVTVGVKGKTSPVTISPLGVKATVAKDGSGNFTTVQAAIDAAPTGQTAPYIIFIKNGKYKEKITIPSNKPFLQFVGESVANTILTFDDYSGKAIPGGGTYGTSNSASVTVNATDFSAINITFENSTGDSPQALAININADRSAFKNCRFLGGQDTVLANGNGNHQYFRNCYIDGTVDFIFGNAIAVFDSCVVHAKTRQDGTSLSYITAANTQNGQPYGYVFRGCTIPSNAGVTKYVLGRPWQNSTGSVPLSFPNVVFINTTVGYNIIKPEGWAIWDAGTVTTSIYDAEYKTKKFNGSLVNTSQRVPWSFQLTDPQAANYSNATLFGSWDPCVLSSDFCIAKPAVIAVTNFTGKKDINTSTTKLSWNIAWPKAQVKYELFRSNDNIAFSKINEQTSANDTTIIYSYSEPIPPAATSYYYYVKASKAGFDPHITETVQISSISTITTLGSLNNFLQGVGLPSSQQAYTVSGANLLGDITITPPAGYEISANGGATWFNNATPLVLTQSGGVVTSKTITVRLNATTAGSYSGNILHTSTGAVTVTVAASGTVQADPLPVSVTLLYWPMSANNNDVAASRAVGVDASTSTLKRLFTSNGTTVSAVPAYSVLHGQAFGPTANGDGTWTGSPGGTLNRKYYEQFTVTALSGYTVRVDSITLFSSFYNTSSNTKLAVVYSKSGFTAADSTDVSGGVSGGIPLVSTANGAFATPVLLLNESSSGTTKNYRFALAGSTGVTINPGQTLYIRAYFSCGSTSAGRYAKVKNVYIKGASQVVSPPPAVTISATLNNFTQTVGNPSSTQTYMVSGSNLTGNITVTPPLQFEISKDGNTWFTNGAPLALAPVSGTVQTTALTVRLNALVAGAYSGNITHVTTGTSTVTVAVNGSTSSNTPVTGIVELNEQIFSVSPNPAHTVIVIHHPQQTRAAISVFTTTGMGVGSYTSDYDARETVIDIKSMADGLYFVRCTSKNISPVMMRFIKR